MASAGIGSRVEGVHAVEAALRAGRVKKLFVEQGRVQRLPQIIRLAEERSVNVVVVEDVRSKAETSAPQGLVAECRPISTMSLTDLVGSIAHPQSILVLDHLQDSHNVGAVARSAVAAGIGGLVVSGVRSAPMGGAVFKAASGALEHIAVSMISSTADAVARLKKLGIWTVGLTADAATSLFDLGVLTEPVAVVLGAEGEGLGRLVADRVDVQASIPMADVSESLNASVAGALAAFEIRRSRD
jgi:23S rRNA (guanosine2251-2'-O)-methyltransferase